jgi:hypothetical protein
VFAVADVVLLGEMNGDGEVFVRADGDVESEVRIDPVSNVDVNRAVSLDGEVTRREEVETVDEFKLGFENAVRICESCEPFEVVVGIVPASPPRAMDLAM